MMIPFGKTKLYPAKVPWEAPMIRFPPKMSPCKTRAPERLGTIPMSGAITSGGRGGPRRHRAPRSSAETGLRRSYSLILPTSRMITVD